MPIQMQTPKNLEPSFGAVGLITIDVIHHGALPTGVTGLPDGDKKSTNRRYESSMTVSGGVVGKFRCSIFPDNLNNYGRIKNGTYDIYLGFHKGVPTNKPLELSRRDGHRACLVVNAKNSVPVISKSKKKVTAVGVDIHNGYNTWKPKPPMSEGCIILHPADWEAFLKLFLDKFPQISDWTTNDSKVGKKVARLKVFSTWGLKLLAGSSVTGTDTLA